MNVERPIPSRLGRAIGMAIMLLGAVSTGQVAAQQSTATGAPGKVATLDSVRPFNVPAQPLDTAIYALAAQAGIDLLVGDAQLQGRTGHAVQGNYSIAAALSQLLDGSGIRFEHNQAQGSKRPSVQLFQLPVHEGNVLSLSATQVNAAHPGDWVYQAPRSVNVVSREQLDRNPPRHAADMLEETTGVYSAVSQQDPGLSVNIRGIQDYGRVNMSVDGMRQNYQQSGHQQRNGTLYVDPDLLSQVVIEKGATSTMGGAGVIGGIANFRTLDASDLLTDGKEIGGRIRATTGLGGLGNGTHFIGSSAFAIGGEVWDMLVAASERHLGDYDPGTKGSIGELRTGSAAHPENATRLKNSPVEYSGSVMRSRLIKLGLNLPQDQRLQLSYLVTNVNYTDANMMNVEKADLWDKLGSNSVRAQNLALDYSYTPDNPLIDFKAKAYHVDNRNEQSTLARGISPAYKVTYQTDTYGLQAQNTSLFALGERSVIKANYGLEFFYDKVRPNSTQTVAEGAVLDSPDSENMTPKGDRGVASLFTRLDYDYDDWFNVNAGLRYDRYRLRGKTGLETRTFVIGTTKQIGESVHYDVDEEQGRFSPTFGLSVKPGLDWMQLFATYGKGWRPPAVTETLISGRPHGGGAEFTYPNPFLKPETSTTWEVGVNVFKDSLFLDGDRIGAKVSYFDTRVDDFIFMNMALQKPGYGMASLGNSAYVNNLKETRFKGIEYQLDYDAGRAYGQFNYTHMIGTNDYCSKTAWLGGVTKIVKKPGSRQPVDAMVSDDIANGSSHCGAILGSAEHMPMDRGTLTLGARFFERKLDIGARARYSGGYSIAGGPDVTVSQGGVYPADWKPYTVYDLYGSYRVNDQLNLRVAMENVTDRAYLVPLGDVLAFTLGRGRTLQGSVEYQF
jgi:heme acquisition protein HasR